MMDLMGGERVFVDKLDKLFSMHLPEKYYEHNEDITEECLVGGYVHGNEPAIIFLISMHGPLNLGKHSTGCVKS